ncbi:hypothetical protein NUU61_005550 [Penicillium alfredii]|uniref:Homeobox domain-containing protein n=1 Tax=Penicillium alfredii TaxID=1506179 RepID=A0A9W9K7P6_9EURO|nr:uncharacterized protein NUU61_005550 [Penicillium alfredii]KAJ5096194.1 hypothetical protein NUU61_005550 [Penicillium alfredii]
MSIGGPCLWLPALSTPVTSHLSAVTSHLSAATRNGEKSVPGSRSTSPRLSLQRENTLGATPGLAAEMHTSGVKAENALSNPMASSTAQSTSSPEEESSSHDTFNPRMGTGKEESPSQAELGIPSGPQPRLLMSQHQDETDHFEDPNGLVSGLHDMKEESDKEYSLSPSVEKAEGTGSDEYHRSPPLDKKKMKRFRLTHNQTRFLMSEFTRQAHPDAAHRQRLSREIPGLTPRQVQVWFQNRRAKLKRLTTNDRERMIKSRALPDDFDTTKVLRTPFEGKSIGETGGVSPQEYAAPNVDFAAPRALRTDGFPRQSEDEYLASPLSSTSTTGTYMSSHGQGRSDNAPTSSMIFSRPAASASMSDLQRTMRNDYPITRSSSVSDTSAQPLSFHHGLSMHNRFTGAQANQANMSYFRRPVDYAVPRHPGIIQPYDQRQSFEDSVSQTDTQGTPVAYDMNHLGSQSQAYPPTLSMSTPKDYTSLGMDSQVPAHARPVPTLSSLPVPAPHEYRQFPYDNTSGSMGTAIPYTHAPASNLSISTSYAPSIAGTTAHDSLHKTPQALDPLLSKFSHPSFHYPNYIQQ